MKLLADYLKMQNDLFDYFGYKEDWRAIPVDDAREYYWHLTGEGHGHKVKFAKDKANLFNGTSNDGYSNDIYAQRFLPKWVYRGKDYTMISVDTHMDGNKFLQIFDNAKEIKAAPANQEQPASAQHTQPAIKTDGLA